MKMLCLNTVGVGTQLSVSNNDKFDYISAEFSKHSETLFPLIEELLTRNKMQVKDLDAVGVVMGPGSFTGIRIGMSVAKIFGYANNIPIIGVNALEVLAYNVVMNGDIAKGVVCATINAGAGKLYYQIFAVEYGVLEPVNQPGIMKIEHLNSYIDRYYPNALVIYNESNEKPIEINQNMMIGEFRADSLALCCSNNYKLGKIQKHNEVMPIYIRDSQAELIMVRSKEDVEFVDKNKVTADEIYELEIQGDNEYNAWSYESIVDILGKDEYGLVLAKYRGKNLGYIAFKQIVDEWEIERVMVNKGARLQGIAKMMLDKLFGWACEKNISKIILEVNEMNYPAYRLYSSVGFGEDGKRKDYYGVGKNAILMSKII